MNLCELVIHAAQQWPDALAVKGADESLTYLELDSLANRFAQVLAHLGVCAGDRVAIWLEKSPGALVAMQATLRLQAAYVPLDPLSPLERVRTILRDGQMRVLVTTRQRIERLQAVQEDFSSMHCCCLDDMGVVSADDGLPLYVDGQLDLSAPTEETMAYILYTSGSTGIPKGVCISHGNALAFVRWAVGTLNAAHGDRFANHAPFHFDLSVLDIYGAFAVGATIVLIPEEISYLPAKLVEFLVLEQPTIWYSVPSILLLMMEHGGMLNVNVPSLHTILYAGEPFPVKYVRCLYEGWPTVRLLNLYGPTETNVCTFYEVTHLPSEQAASIPIGIACSGDQVWAQKKDGCVAQVDEIGELMVSGPTAMMGYWGQPLHGDRPYATGDLACLQADGNYLYIGRRDHMVKVRGYRIEPGDIEAVLLTHAAIQDVAVIVQGTGIETRLVACIVCHEQGELSLLDLKRHCAERLPRYMIIDALHILSGMPRTRNGKIDRKFLHTRINYIVKEQNSAPI